MPFPDSADGPVMGVFNPISLASVSSRAGRISRAQAQYNQTLERLATGKQINRASDDPSGLVALQGSLKPQAARLEKSIAGLERQNLYLNARDGALSVVADLTIQLDSLVTSAANTGGLSDEELDALQIEANSIVQTIDELSRTSTFQDQQILSGFSAAELGLAGAVDLRSGDLEAVQEATSAAADRVTRDRAVIGTQVLANESEMAAKQEELINLTGEISRLEDADYAKEVATLVRQEILLEANIRVELIMREQSQAVLTLLDNASINRNS